MITYDHIMIRFGELSTKAKTKKISSVLSRITLKTLSKIGQNYRLKHAMTIFMLVLIIFHMNQ